MVLTRSSSSLGFALAAWVILFAATGCVRRSDVQVRVTNESGADAASVENLTVFVGGSKSWWPTIAPGESVSVTLPPEGEAPQVSLVYTASGTKKNWKGPSLRTGIGYAVDLRVAPDGSVTERHCARPCTLP
jgi:hypothetical protein